MLARTRLRLSCDALQREHLFLEGGHVAAHLCNDLQATRWSVHDIKYAVGIVSFSYFLLVLDDPQLLLDLLHRKQAALLQQ